MKLRNPHPFPLFFAVFACVSVAIVGRAAAAPIAWGSATTISGDSDVATVGASVFAYNWANSTQTVNGQAFTPPSTDVTLSNMNFDVNTTTFTSTADPFASLSAAYKSVLVGASYNLTNGTTGTVTLNDLLDLLTAA
jgi:hypothetical protein